MNNDKKVIIGKIGAPFGVEGYLKIYSYTEPDDNLAQYKKWFLQKSEHANNWQVYDVIDIKRHAKAFIAKIATAESREDAALLTNSYIAVNRDDLPVLDDDNNYIIDLIGFEVVNASGEKLGTVKDFFSTNANDIMVVINSENEEILIPYIEGHHVIEVDVDEEIIKVDFEYDA